MRATLITLRACAGGASMLWPDAILQTMASPNWPTSHVMLTFCLMVLAVLVIVAFIVAGRQSLAGVKDAVAWLPRHVASGRRSLREAHEFRLGTRVEMI